MPTDRDVKAEDDESRFANGRLAMLLQSRRVTPTFRIITGFDWDVAPLPRFWRSDLTTIHNKANAGSVLISLQVTSRENGARIRSVIIPWLWAPLGVR